MDTGETGIAGATVTLTSTDDLGNSVNTPLTTTDGTFNYTGLRPGNYTVMTTPSSGHLNGKDAAGPLGGNASVQNQISQVLVDSGASGVHYNFGELQPGIVSGFLYNDANDEVTKQATEADVPGATVALTGTDDRGTVVNGEASGTVATPSASGVLSTIKLNPGDLFNDEVFGQVRPASLAGSIYIDHNGDGVRQPSEIGLANLGVALAGADDLGRSVSGIRHHRRLGPSRLRQPPPWPLLARRRAASGNLPGRGRFRRLGGRDFRPRRRPRNPPGRRSVGRRLRLRPARGIRRRSGRRRPGFGHGPGHEPSWRDRLLA